MKTIGIILRIWLITAVIFASGLFIYLCFDEQSILFIAFPAALVAALVGSIPGFGVLLICLSILRNTGSNLLNKLLRFLFFQFVIAVVYGLAGSAVFFGFNFGGADHSFYAFAGISMALFACTFCATILSTRKLAPYFSPNIPNDISFQQSLHLFFHQQNKTNTTMETVETTKSSSNHSNRILVKGFVTGGLILLMLIPTIFIQNLISERQQRQKEVVKEVSSKWASAQNLSGPFLTVPYTQFVPGENGKILPEKTTVILLPQNLKVQSEMTPEKRTRSIYNVLLYKSNTDFAGAFNVKLPTDIIVGNLDF